MADTSQETLRTEAQAVDSWTNLTSDQEEGIKRLLRMLTKASVSLDYDLNQPPNPRVPWLEGTKYSPVAFIHGKRGTGKTTLMTTLVSLLAGKQRTDLPEDVRNLAGTLRDRVIIVEPLDMEPLPNDTPILAAILARVYDAISRWSSRPEPHCWVDSDGDSDHRGKIRFKQFQARVARALDSNLASRKGSLDPEQYGQAVMEQEQDRLGLQHKMEEVLSHLSNSLHGNDYSQEKSKKCKYLFLVPIDDVDLRPDRCLELLRIVRTYSPKQMFFLLMGQWELVETIVKLQMSRSYLDVQGSRNELSAVPADKLKRQLSEVAAANAQKMIPDRIELPEIAVSEILDFVPLTAEDSDA